MEKVNSPGKRLTIADVATAGGVDLYRENADAVFYAKRWVSLDPT